MSTSTQIAEPTSIDPRMTMPESGEPQWYAIHTRPKHERSVASRLQGQGIATFLPCISQVHVWSDRRKVLQVPLFSCYAFVHLCLSPESWYNVLRVNGVLRFVGVRGQGVPVPESQIESIRAVLSSNVPFAVCPFLKVGQRVRVRGGSLDGIEGLLTARNGDRTLVISVEPIQRSISVRVGDYQVEPI